MTRGGGGHVVKDKGGGGQGVEIKRWRDKGWRKTRGGEGQVVEKDKGWRRTRSGE